MNPHVSGRILPPTPARAVHALSMHNTHIIIAFLFSALSAADDGLAFGRIELRLVEQGISSLCTSSVEIYADHLVVTVVEGNKQVHSERRALTQTDRHALVTDLHASSLLDSAHATILKQPKLTILVDQQIGAAKGVRAERQFSAQALERISEQAAAKRFFNRIERLTE